MSINDKEIGNETYGFDAIRGIQATREFYVAMCPLKIIPKLFVFNDFDIPPEMRAQRTLKESRIPAIKDYILNNPKDYIFSSLTASVDGKMKFFPSPALGDDAKLGRLYINMDSKLLINDGQHRRKAIEEALKENPELGHEMISVVFFRDDGLKRSQQMFSDLNKNAVKPSKSLNILYDHRNEASSFIVDMINDLEIFQNRTELEKTTISNRSKNAFTLNGIFDASLKLIGKTKSSRISEEKKKLIQNFWQVVSKYIPQWQSLINETISPYDVRQEFISTNTNVLNAIGIAGKKLIQKYPDSWEDKLKNLKNINWARDASIWEGSLIIHGQLQRQTKGIELASEIIFENCQKNEKR
jgi:DNA sulfur modification protein DndB